LAQTGIHHDRYLVSARFHTASPLFGPCRRQLKQLSRVDLTR